MTILTPARKNRVKHEGQKVVLLPQGQLPTKEEFTEWRESKSLDDSVRVYLPANVISTVQPFVRKKNRGMFEVAYQLAAGVAREIPGDNPIYFSSMKLRQHLGMTTKKSDLNAVLENSNRLVTRLSVVLPELKGLQGKNMLDEIIGHYIQREHGNRSHVVATDNITSSYKNGVSFRPFSEHADYNRLLEATVRMDKENGPFDDFQQAIPLLAKDVVEDQFYNAQAVDRYDIIDFK